MLLVIALALLVSGQAMAAGIWASLENKPESWIQHMLLLSDGTVMAQSFGDKKWYRLTPDSYGSYIGGTWSTTTSADHIATMHDDRRFYASQVLKDGRIFVAGAEYSSSNGKYTAELYNPVANNWTLVPVPVSLLDPTQNELILDAASALLPNGSVLVSPVQPKIPSQTLIFDPTSATWSAGPISGSTPNGQDEASWVKLPDDSILTVDPNTNNSERYIPALNQWVPDATVPVALYDTLPGYVGEIGPAFLLPDGRAFFLGATGKTAYYTPSGNISAGTWALGPDIPSGLVAADAPAAMMPNGKILCAFAAAPYVSAGNVVFPTPTTFYEFDPIATPSFPLGKFALVSSPPGFPTNVPTFPCTMLDLPDGTVLLSYQFDQLYVYVPDGSPLAAGKPVISSVAANVDGSYHLSGTKLNGISEGAAYGDDAQMSSNYPLVRLRDGSGHEYYARTHNWSNTGVQTGSTPVSTDFSLPLVVYGNGGPYSLVVVANGISSDPVPFTPAFPDAWVDFNSFIFPEVGSYALPYSSMNHAVNGAPPFGGSGVPNRGTIYIKGPSTSSELLTITKAMTIKAVGGPVTIGH